MAETTNSGRTYSVVGLICVMLTLIFTFQFLCTFLGINQCLPIKISVGITQILPFIFGLASIISGFVGRKKGDDKFGLIVIILGIVFSLIGLITIFMVRQIQWPFL